METIWIIGVGHFGLLAAERLSTGASRHLVLVDLIQENLLRAAGPNRTLVLGDGIQFLEDHLCRDNLPEWVVPALPVHLAAQWCHRQLGTRIRPIPLPSEIDACLPNPFRGADGNLYVSHASFKCPDDCAEPQGRCTVTRQPRKRNMFDLLGELAFSSFQPLVIRSHQLKPGVGGYRPGQLHALLEKAEMTQGDLLICTACRCHGVITAFRRL